MADSNIEQLLKQILDTKLGKDMRQAIHDGIEQCYEDGKVGAVDLVARQRIDNLAKLPEGSTTGDAALNDIRIGYDGTTYDTPGDAVRGQVETLHNDLDSIKSEKVHTFNTDFVSSDIYQFVDDSAYISGSYYNISDGKIVIKNAPDYKRYPEISLLPGTYYLYLPTTAAFCFIQVGETLSKIQDSEYWQDTSTEDGENRSVINCSREFSIFFSGPQTSIYRIATGNFDTKNAYVGTWDMGYYGSKKLFGVDIFQELENMSNEINLISDPLDEQILDLSVAETNKYWPNQNTMSTSSYTGQYMAYPQIPIKKGTYFFKNIASAFTWLIIGDASYNFSNYDGVTVTAPATGILVLSEDALICATGYIANSNDKWAIISTTDIPLSPYVYKYYIPNENSDNNVYYVGSSRQYKTIKSALEEATKYMDSEVHLDPETFDLVEEFGTDFLESYSDALSTGLLLKNRVHLIGTPKTLVKFDYTGSNEYIQKHFSPFNAGQYGFILEEINIYSKNCRYSVHDERGGSSDAYKNVYKRCTMYHDSSESTWGAHQAIGGGLGVSGDILIEDCNLTSVGNSDTVSYHNNTSLTQETQSKVVVRNTWMSGSFLCTNNGTSTTKSLCMVNGCSLASLPKLSKTIEEDRADNMELLEWGNIVR